MSPISRKIFTLGSLAAILASVVTGQATCSVSWKQLSAKAYVAALSPGWNLGNSLDAFPNENSWNNPAVTASTFDVVKKTGFKSVRVPVTWAYHFTGTSNQGDSPLWNVDPVFLQRVSDVIDQILSRNLYAIVNVHHDSRLWADLTTSGANWPLIEEKFYRLWFQIGTKLACKSSKLAFEPLNEPPASTPEQTAELHKLNDIFLKAIKDSGGFNAKRVVTLVGPGEDIIATSLWWTKPDPIYTNPYAIQFHYYSPYDFTSAAWGKTIWGSSTDKAALEADFAHIHDNFTDIPLVVGEWLTSPVFTEPASRWNYWDFLTRTAKKYNMATIVWDNGNDLLDRAAATWRDSTAIDIHVKATVGIVNSLPGTTTDASATTQWTSAYIFNKVGQIPTNQTLPFLLNGNTVRSIQAGSRTLSKNIDYAVSGNDIIIRSSFLSRYISATTAPGNITTLVITFSAGAKIPVNIVQWDVPTLPVSNSTAVAGSDISVAINWKGVGKPAAVAAIKSDGIFLVDDWTIWLPPLQQGRTTLGGQWNWGWAQGGVTITSGAVQSVISSGQATSFIIDAYPRVPGNSVNYTLYP